MNAQPRPPVPPGPYVVAGLAKAGAAAAAALRSVSEEPVIAWDEHRCEPTEAAAVRLSSLGVEVVFGHPDGLLDSNGGVGCLVKSPGIPADIPLIAAAEARGIPVIDELELGWRLGSHRLIAVTGTNGKSTTVALLQRALERAGMATMVAGNSDLGPALSAVPATEADWIICEVSSFQLEATTHFLPEVALFTNLTHDHLHRHGTMAAYARMQAGDVRPRRPGRVACGRERRRRVRARAGRRDRAPRRAGRALRQIERRRSSACSAASGRATRVT